MLKRHLPIRAVSVAICLSLLGVDAQAAYFEVSTSDSYPPAPPTTWNPRADQGLIAVMSEETDYYSNDSYTQIGWSYEQGTYVEYYRKIYEGQSFAATYGSDTSANWMVDPRLYGTSIEPMAHAVATTKMTCVKDVPDLGIYGQPVPCISSVSRYATATASVAHRVVRTGSEGRKISQVPLWVDYRLEATSSKAAGPDLSEAKASFSMGALRVLAQTNPNSICPPTAQCFLNEASDRVRFIATVSTDDDIVPFIITVRAEAYALSTDEYGRRILDGSAQAVADPFVYVDPDWQYAPYFMVQQESLLHPGEWAEVTRIWQQPVPEPQTWAMLLAGLGLVGVAVTRRG